MDVTDPSAVRGLATRLRDEIGVPSVLVNNAAMNDMVESPTSEADESRFENYPFDLFRKVMDVNVGGMFLCCQLLGGLMAEHGDGSIINIASTYGVVAPDQRIYRTPDGDQPFYKSAAYPVSKGAVVMLTRFLATYWAERNVRVNALSPGGVENGQPAHFIENYASRTPLGRMAASTDYMGALVFLASAASSYMTGQNLVVDGGWTAW
jgi:NAD(P)-dependent dehydrogenase (short-subunit alcohol dehydrogenase family)